MTTASTSRSARSAEYRSYIRMPCSRAKAAADSGVRVAPATNWIRLLRPCTLATRCRPQLPMPTIAARITLGSRRRQCSPDWDSRPFDGDEPTSGARASEEREKWAGAPFARNPADPEPAPARRSSVGYPARCPADQCLADHCLARAPRHLDFFPEHIAEGE